jgi:hypothetical protein
MSPMRARISCRSSFDLRLLHGEEPEHFEIRDFACDVNGNEITLEAEVRKYINAMFFKIPLSTRITLSLTADFEDTTPQSFRRSGLRFVSTAENRDPSIGSQLVAAVLRDMIDEMASRILGALKSALEEIDLPIEITAYDGKTLHFIDGYLAGGLCLLGRTGEH